MMKSMYTLDEGAVFICISGFRLYMESLGWHVSVIKEQWTNPTHDKMISCCLRKAAESEVTRVIAALKHEKIYLRSHIYKIAFHGFFFLVHFLTCVRYTTIYPVTSDDLNGTQRDGRLYFLQVSVMWGEGGKQRVKSWQPEIRIFNVPTLFPLHILGVNSYKLLMLCLFFFFFFTILLP